MENEEGEGMLRGMNDRVVWHVFRMILLIMIILSRPGLASTTAHLRISVNLHHGACSPHLSNNGIVDYGNIQPGMRDGDVSRMEDKTVQLVITCDAPTRVAFTATDNRADTPDIALMHEMIPGTFFGLGRSTEGHSLGGYSLTVRSATTDISGAGDTGVSYGGKSWFNARGKLMMNDGTSLFTSENEKPFRYGLFSLGIETRVSGARKLHITDDTSLNGKATILLVYQ